MEILFHGEAVLVRKFAPCCRCGQEVEVILLEQHWKKFKRTKSKAVCPDCLKSSDSEEEREMYTDSPKAPLLLMVEDIFVESEKEKYSEYLRSKHWQETRKGALERAHNRCQLCNSPDNLHVHHRTYENIGKENPEDLIALCRGCHYLFHKRMKLD